MLLISVFFNLTSSIASSGVACNGLLVCLQVVVGANFHEIVTSTKSHVLIYFHSPWCGECPEVDKVFEKLAVKVGNLLCFSLTRRIEFTIENVYAFIRTVFHPAQSSTSYYVTGGIAQLYRLSLVDAHTVSLNPCTTK